MTNREAAIQIITRLREAGFEALLAGGCVRDMLLSRKAKDFDVATDARPKDVQKLFRRTLEVGAKFGVVIVMVNSQQVEVATFRTESGYADGRHPEKVAFSNAKEDASRRDFTINGMFYDPLGDEIFDYVDGVVDIEAKVLRTIGDADERFGEDYLRMLRAVRFSAQLDFEIEDNTWKAVCLNSEKITCISGERISMEIETSLTNENRATAAGLLCRSGMAKVIFSGFEGEDADFGIEVLSALPKEVSYMLAMSAFFAGFDIQFAMNKIELLMLSNSQVKQLNFLLENRGVLLDEKISLADLKILLASGYCQELFQLQRAIEKVKGKSLDALEANQERMKLIDAADIEPKPLLNGNELMEMGVGPGPSVGKAAAGMYYAQLDEELKSRDQAVDWVKKWMAEG
jgi:poly(A) polymerase